MLVLVKKQQHRQTVPWTSNWQNLVMCHSWKGLNCLRDLAPEPHLTLLSLSDISFKGVNKNSGFAVGLLLIKVDQIVFSGHHSNWFHTFDSCQKDISGKFSPHLFCKAESSKKIATLHCCFLGLFFNYCYYFHLWIRHSCFFLLLLKGLVKILYCSFILLVQQSLLALC